MSLLHQLRWVGAVVLSKMPYSIGLIGAVVLPYSIGLIGAVGCPTVLA